MVCYANVNVALSTMMEIRKCKRRFLLAHTAASDGRLDKYKTHAVKFVFAKFVYYMALYERSNRNSVQYGVGPQPIVLLLKCCEGLSLAWGKGEGVEANSIRACTLSTDPRWR